MTEQVNFSIGKIDESDDIRPAYQGAYDQRERNSAIDWLGSGEAEEDTPSPSAPNAPQLNQTDTPASPGSTAPTDAAPAAAPANEEEGGILSTVGAVASDVGRGLTEAVPQAMGGVIDALGEVDQFMQSVLPVGGMQLWDKDGNFDPSLIGPDEMQAMQKAEQTLFDVMAPEKADSVTGGLIRSTSQFLTGFLPAFGAMRAIGAGTAVAGLGGGAVADMVALDPNEARLSTYLNEVPALSAIVPDYLAAHGGDEGEWEGRIKNAIEGAGLGLATEGLLKAFKYYKAQRGAKPEAVPNDATSQIQKAALTDDQTALAKAEMQTEVSDEMLAPLGNPADDAPLLIEARPDETLQASISRQGAAAERMAVAVEKNDALGKINALIDTRKGKQSATSDPASPAPDAMDEALDALRGKPAANVKLPARPVATIVRDLGGIDPASSLAGGLRSRGITNKTFPGLYKKGGLQSLDNVPAAEHPLFIEQGRANADGYVDQQGFIDALEAENKGQPWRTGEQQSLFDDVVRPSEELEIELSRLGIDYENMSNQAVKERLTQIADEEAAFKNYQEGVLSRIDDGDESARSLGELEVEQREIWTVEQTAEARSAGVDEAIITSHQPNKVYINMARIKAPEDVKALIQSMADMDAAHIDSKRRGVVSNEQTIKESSKEYQDLDSLIGRPPGPMSASQAVAARKLLASSAEQVRALAIAAANPNAGKVDQYNLMRALSVHGAIQSEVIAARTETARALQSWAIPAGAERVRTDMISDLIANNGGKNIGDIAKIIAGSPDIESAVNSVSRDLLKTNLKDAAHQIWINGLLSGPKTHLANILSNSAVALYSIPERYVSSAFSKAFFNGEIEVGEVTAQAYGLIEGLRDGLRLAYLGNKAQGTDNMGQMLAAFTKSETRRPGAISADAFGLTGNGGFAYGVDMLGKVIDVPGNMLEREDLFFKAVNYRMELKSLAYRTANQEGLEGDAWAKRVAEITNNPPANIMQDAVQRADINTFTNPLGEQGRNFQRLAASTPLRWIIPFIRTPTNIMKFAFARTPLAYAMSSVKSDIAAGGARAAQAHARVALGTTLMMTTAGMAIDGTISGSGPLDPKLKAAKRAGGWQEYSIKLGDKWYAYNRLDPIGTMIGLSADIAEITNSGGQEDATELVTAGVVALAQNLASKTYMQGVIDFIGAIDPRNPTNDIGTYLMNQGASLMPYSSFVRQVKQGLDPVTREAKDPAVDESGEVDAVGTFLNRMVNTYKKNIPGLSDSLPPVRDIFGEEMTSVSGVGAAFDMFVPIRATTDKNDPVTKAIVDNEIKVSKPSNIVSGVRLTGEQYDELQQIAGPLVRQRLDQLVRLPAFKNASDGPDGMKAELIKDIVTTSHAVARNQLLAKNPELRERYRGKMMKTRNLLLGN